jgi:pimeloyl-ACP methyl ester carboxylesterase
VPAINARILARCIPGSELEVVPHAGHLLLMDHAERSATRIAQFLSD